MTLFITSHCSERGSLCSYHGISSSFSSLAIMVLVFNFSNPYKTAGFLSFLKKEDAKKTDNSLVEVKGCLIKSMWTSTTCLPSPVTTRS